MNKLWALGEHLLIMLIGGHDLYFTCSVLPHPRVKVSIVGSLRDQEVACSASDRQGSNFESCVWRTVSPHSSHHPQEVLLAQFSLYVHKGGLKPDLFHFIFTCSVYIAQDRIFSHDQITYDITAIDCTSNYSTEQLAKSVDNDTRHVVNNGEQVTTTAEIVWFEIGEDLTLTLWTRAWTRYGHSGDTPGTGFSLTQRHYLSPEQFQGICLV